MCSSSSLSKARDQLYELDFLLLFGLWLVLPYCTVRPRTEQNELDF